VTGQLKGEVDEEISGVLVNEKNISKFIMEDLYTAKKPQFSFLSLVSVFTVRLIIW
jgi:hypothetical protein